MSIDIDDDFLLQQCLLGNLNMLPEPQLIVFNCMYYSKELHIMRQMRQRYFLNVEF